MDYSYDTLDWFTPEPLVRPRLFAHTHGFYSLGKYIPREIYICQVYPPFKGQGIVVDLSEAKFSERDVRANEYTSREISGLKFPCPKMQGQVPLRDLKIRIHEMVRKLGGGLVASKGESQIKFFDEDVKLEPVLKFPCPKMRGQVPFRDLKIRVGEIVRKLGGGLVACNGESQFKFFDDYVKLHSVQDLGTQVPRFDDLVRTRPKGVTHLGVHDWVSRCSKFVAMEYAEYLNKYFEDEEECWN